ncbi:hypothetical protein BJ742DRAFT_854578 [Cladochytrium replicatum]|nr:hypothetical protein BJ742DRAFT_854578 [Cladochytrium replicatum]
MEIESRPAAKRVEDAFGKEKAWELAASSDSWSPFASESGWCRPSRTIAISKVLRPYMDAVLDRLRNHENTFVGVRSADDWKAQRGRVCAYGSSLLCVADTLRTWSDEDDVYIEMGRAIKGGEGDAAGLWDSVCSAYECGCESVGFRILVDAAVQEFLRTFEPTRKNSRGKTTDPCPPNSPLALDPALDPRALRYPPRAAPSRARLARRFAEKVDTVVYDCVLLREVFDDSAGELRSMRSERPSRPWRFVGMLEQRVEESCGTVEAVQRWGEGSGAFDGRRGGRRQAKRKVARVEDEMGMLEGIGMFALTVEEVVTLVQNRV